MVAYLNWGSWEGAAKDVCGYSVWQLAMVWESCKKILNYNYPCIKQIRRLSGCFWKIWGKKWYIVVIDCFSQSHRVDKSNLPGGCYKLSSSFSSRLGNLYKMIMCEEWYMKFMYDCCTFEHGQKLITYSFLIGNLPLFFTYTWALRRQVGSLVYTVNTYTLILHIYCAFNIFFLRASPCSIENRQVPVNEFLS